MFYLRHLAVLLLLLCILSSSIADTLDTIEVFGTRDSKAEITDVNLKTYNGFAEAINRTEFEHYLTDVGDILDLSISTQIRKTSGNASFSAASIRGSSGKQIHLYMDGMLLSSPQNGSSPFNAIPVSMIEQIEIYPDFTPAQFGDANLGGAINLRTRKPQQGMGGRVAASFASFDTQQLDVDWWAGNAQTDIVLAASMNKSDNDYPIDTAVCEKLDMTCGNSRHRLSAKYQQQSLFGKLRHQFNDRYSLHVLAATSHGDSDIPSQTNRHSHKAQLEQALHQFNVLLQADYLNGHWGVRTYSHIHNEIFSNPTAGTLILGGSDIEQNMSSHGINGFAQYTINHHTLAMALDYSQARSKTDDRQRDMQLQASRDKLSLSLSDYWQLLPVFALNATLRANHLDDKSEAPATAIGVSAYCTNTAKHCLSHREQHYSWQLGFAITPKQWTIKANIGDMVRAPNLSERFGQTGAMLGNAELKKEQSFNMDIGLLYQHDRFDMQWTMFHKTLSDGIFLLFDARGVAKPMNIAKAEIFGSEALLTLKLHRYVQLYAGGQWMDSENQSDVAADRGQKLQTIYHQSLQTGIRLNYQQHQWQLSYHLDDEMYFDPANRIEAPSRKRLDTRYTWFLDNFSLNFSINNVLDERYFDFNFMPAVGRHYSTTLTYYF